MHVFTAQFMFLQLVLGKSVTNVWVTVLNTLTHHLRGFSKRQYHYYNKKIQI